MSTMAAVDVALITGGAAGTGEYAELLVFIA